MKRQEIIAALRGRADEAAAICAGLSEDEMGRVPKDGEWSLLEICCHLRDNAAEEGTRIRRMVKEDNPTLAPYDPDAWAAERNYAAEDPKPVLTALRTNWSRLADLLEGLLDDDWGRGGTHPEAGAVIVETWAADEVKHSAQHLEQMRAARAAIGSA